ncbi:hypothetical protein H4219_006436 [Mycoemilia scoparia]|uniref:Uncharacterized protein n=1 Tax=Mycoemilia scoparia TaxID=417184 RepID=A0A9W8DLT7_9FUNG|nr:hypothetical protein H4219_006436 [Mycoemilia scoparia]
MSAIMSQPTMRQADSTLNALRLGQSSEIVLQRKESIFSGLPTNLGHGGSESQTLFLRMVDNLGICSQSDGPLPGQSYLINASQQGFIPLLKKKYKKSSHLSGGMSSPHKTKSLSKQTEQLLQQYLSMRAGSLDTDTKSQASRKDSINGQSPIHSQQNNSQILSSIGINLSKQVFTQDTSQNNPIDVINSRNSSQQVMRHYFSKPLIHMYFP